MDNIKITNLQFENVKKIKVVQLELKENGLTIIGGDNAQGKTSVLDAIAWTLGGDKFAPSNPTNSDSLTPAKTAITLSNGLYVERCGKNSTLKVTDLRGNKAGQTLLNEFITTFALDLPKFMNANNKEKAFILLEALGLKQQVLEIEQTIGELYNKRTIIGREADSLIKHANCMPVYSDVPVKEISINNLIEEQNSAIQANQAKSEISNQIQVIKKELQGISETIIMQQDEVLELERKISTLKYNIAENQQTEFEQRRLLHETQHSYLSMPEYNIAEYRQKFTKIEETNQQVRANIERNKIQKQSNEKQEQYNKLSAEIEQKRSDVLNLINGSKLPLKDLSVENQTLFYKNQEWDCMSGAEKLIVSTCIVKSINPKCGFVLMDNFESLDLKTLQEFNEWCVAQNLQVIATRVSQGDECSIIIENGEQKNVVIK